MRVSTRLDRSIIAIGVVGLLFQSMVMAIGSSTSAASAGTSVKCLGKPATIVGSNGDNVIKGTPRKDVINARGGEDVVKSVGAGDKVCGGSGPDQLKGGKGDDVLSGGKGADTLNGGAGTDTCKDSSSTTYELCEKPKFELQVDTGGAGGGTVTSSPVGINCGVDCTHSYAPGTMVELVAAPDEQSVFAGWSTSGGECDIASPETCVVTMNSEATATAFFAATYTLSVSRIGTGTGVVTSNVDGINCGANCSENYLDGSIVELTADPDDGSSFDGWSGDCSGTGTCEVTMDQARSVSATFTTIVFALVVSRNGSGTGTVTSSPEGIDCGADCIQGYPSGTIVTLTADPDDGSSFSGWSGGGCSGTGDCVVTMDDGKAVTATFGT